MNRLGPLVLALAILAAIGPLHPTRDVIGSATVDGFGTQWFFWFAGEVLAGRQPLGTTDLFFYPWGKDLYAHTGGNLLDAFLAWPLRTLFGPVLGFNLWILAILASNAWAGTRLAAAFGVPEGRRWPAGLLLVWNPYLLAELDLGRPTQAWAAPAALGLAALVPLPPSSGGGPGRGAGVRGAVTTGLCLALTALGYWYYGLLLGAVAAIHGLWRIAAGPDRRRAFWTHGVAATVALIGTLPFAWRLLGELGAGAVPGLLALDGDGVLAPLALRTVEGDAQGLYVVAPLVVKAGSLLDDGGLRFNPGLPALGYVHLLLAAVGVIALGRRHGWVLVAMLATLAVACGPALIAGDAVWPNRPYIFLTEHLDVLRRWWWPGRAVLFFHLLLAPMGALLLARAGRWAVPAGVAVVIALALPLRRDALLPVGRWDATVPSTLACLSRAPAGAVVDVPLLTDQRNLWYQTIHRHPILGGMLLKKVAFAPPEAIALRSDNVLLQELLAIGERRYVRGAEEPPPEARAALVGLGYRYVLARKDQFGHDRDGVWVSDWNRASRQLAALLGPVGEEDEALALWALAGGTVACP